MTAADQSPPTGQNQGLPASATQPSAQAGERKNRRLGRGLASLISMPPAAQPVSVGQVATAVPGPVPADQASQRPAHSVLANLLVASIEPNPFQPRRHFDSEALAGLAESIKANGLVQPILVRRHREQIGPDPRFELVAGERRWRAARLAGLESLPAIIKPIDDDAALELALIENIQRAELNPIERASAYRAMLASRRMSMDELGQRTGESRASVNNYLRLLDLPLVVQDMLAAGSLSYGHARAVLGLRQAEHQQMLAEAIVKQHWSVRQVELIVSEALRQPSGENSLPQLLATANSLDGVPRQKSRVVHEPAPKPANIASLEEKLTRRLGTRVSIRQGRRADLGKVVIDFYCLDDFDRIMDALGIVPD